MPVQVIATAPHTPCTNMIRASLMTHGCDWIHDFGGRSAKLRSTIGIDRVCRDIIDSDAFTHSTCPRTGLASFFNQQFGKDALIDKKTLNASIAHALDSPATTRLIDDFLDVFLKSPEMAVAESPAPAASGLLRAGSKLGSSTSSLAGRASPKTLLQRATGRGPRNSPSPPTIGGGGSRGSSGSSSPEASSSKLSSSKRYGVEHFVIACREMHAQCAGLFAGTIIVGNGRSVLGGGAGACVDQFATVMRFNDFQISGFEKDVGKKDRHMVRLRLDVREVIQQIPRKESVDEVLGGDPLSVYGQAVL